MTTLPRPDFVDRDPVAIERDMIAAFEASTGRTLRPGQVESLLIKVLAYRETLVRTQIQHAAEQNLVAYARYPMLDLLGELVGVDRRGPQPSQATLRFTLVGVQGMDVIVPAGTRARTADQLLTVATVESLIIPTGQTTGDIRAIATAPGATGNGYLPGAIAALIDAVGYVASVTNTTVSFGGADQESDDRLRDRIRLAPESFSVAGSRGAYRYHALTASATIIDVSVDSTLPGRVEICVLASSGLPTPELLALVAAAVNGEKIRPLTDTVIVAAPDEVNYTIVGTIHFTRGADAVATLALAQAAAASYAVERRTGLGRDIVPSQLIAALSVEGVYRVDLTQPAYDALAPNEWANCTSINLAAGSTFDG